MQDMFSMFVKEEIFLEECESLTEGILERMGLNAGRRLRLLRAASQLGSNLLLRKIDNSS